MNIKALMQNITLLLQKLHNPIIFYWYLKLGVLHDFLTQIIFLLGMIWECFGKIYVRIHTWCYMVNMDYEN